MNISPALTGTVTALRDILQEAAAGSQEAHAALAQQNRNLAMGTLLPLENKLPTATSLLQATLALHRVAIRHNAVLTPLAFDRSCRVSRSGKTTPQRGGAVLSYPPMSVPFCSTQRALPQQPSVTAGFGRFASRGHESIKNSTHVVNFPHPE